MKTTEQLINNIVGQLNGINKMTQDNKDCFATIIQMKAVKSAMNSLMNKYMEENFIKCLKGCHKKDGEDMLKKLILELTKNN